PAHHLLDPGTGRPAFTGGVQATALAPTATEAEILAKAAVLSGPERALSWLRQGGVLVFEDGAHRRIYGPRALAPSASPSGRASPPRAPPGPERCAPRASCTPGRAPVRARAR